MTITRDPINIIGTESASGITVGDGSNQLSAEQDVLGDNKSVASLNLFVRFTSTTTTGKVDVSIFPIFDAGGPTYDDAAPLVLSVPPKNGTTSAVVNLPAARLPAARFFKVNVLNNGTGQNITNLFVGAEVTVTS